MRGREETGGLTRRTGGGRAIARVPLVGIVLALAVAGTGAGGHLVPYPCEEGWLQHEAACVPWVRLDSGDQFRHNWPATWDPAREGLHIVIDTEEQWVAFWNEDEGPRPSMDFSSEWVAVIVDGHWNCCSDFEVDAVASDGATNHYTVFFEHGPSCCSQALSSPYDVVKVVRHDPGPVTAQFIGPPWPLV